MKKIEEPSIVLIIPYFGTFPNYFQLFLNSCKYNSSISWKIVTDCTNEYDFPQNVERVQIQFEELVARIQSKFDFSIVMKKAYKLCDFKPAYGYIFEDLIEGFDYWGYCDMDVIFGNIRKYLPKNMYDYSKLFTLGHFTLIKNEPKYNKAFMSKIAGEDYYKEVFTQDRSFNFDEEFKTPKNINRIFEMHDYPIYKDSCIADIYTKSSDFRLVNEDGGAESKKKGFFVWSEGNLYRFYEDKGTIKRSEYMYIHLQKRGMQVKLSEQKTTCYKIIPNAFDKLECERDDVENFFYHIKGKNPNLQYFRIRSKNLIVKLKRQIERIGR